PQTLPKVFHPYFSAQHIAEPSFFVFDYTVGMSLLYTGIDEAGYGPMLGPLCVGRASLKVEGWEPVGDDGEATRVPDVWGLLSSVVARTRKEAKGRITVADSKKLKLASSSVRNHPLVHLERGVLAMLGTMEGCEVPATDLELFELLGVEVEDQPWFGGGAIELPVGNEIGMLKIDSNGLRAAMHKAGVSVVDLKVHAMGVGDFNAVVRAHGTKAATTAQLLLEHLRATKVDESCEDIGADYSRVVIDRQSGRTHYHKLLSRVWDGLETLEESARASRYSGGRGQDQLGVLLVSKADDAYFPVSLASMAAKYVRELMMARFNRYWSAKLPGLKPTAGYVQDARRWLVDAEGVLGDGDREALVRIA
ncbi:MAG: hypothetical protein AB8C13_05135, partial [Phycisphaerales bacterium]